jgi:DNA-binding transcriptional LysR family regulator
MNLTDLETFLAVAEAGSVGGAARRLNLTQPAVSRRVQSLERDLGTTLLRRDSKPPRLTADGEATVVAGRRVREAVDALRASVAIDAEPVGQLRLGIAQAVGDLVLGKPIGVLRAAYPRLSLALHSGWSPELLAQVEGGALDGAAVLLRAGSTPPSELRGELLSTEDIIVVGSAVRASPTAARSAARWTGKGCRFRWRWISSVRKRNYRRWRKALGWDWCRGRCWR